MGISLKKQLEELSKPASVDFDIEDTESKVFDGGFDSEDESGSGSDSDSKGKNKLHDGEHYVKVGKSKLRRGMDELDLGEKYQGKVLSRSELYENGREEESEESEEGSDKSEEENEEESEDVSDAENDLQNDSDEVSMDDSEDEFNQDFDSDSDNNREEEESYKREKLKSLMDDERKHIINRLSALSKTDAIKGYAILQQHKIFDQVIDSRIKLQKLLTASNELPISKLKYEQEVESQGELKKKRKATVNKLYGLLDQVIQLRSELFVKDKIIKTDQGLTKSTKNKKKRTLDQYLETTNEYDQILNNYRDGVLLKWSQKINSASGASALNSSKFKAINQDSLKQVQNNLADLDKLVKRTQLNRKNLKPVGGIELDLEQGDRTLQYSSHIFDDEDFYRVLLNDLIDKKMTSNEKISSNLTISKLPLKLHKNYERKASKGRKLNYQIQETLANFEAPRNPRGKWGDDQIDEFFASLLGQKVNMNESDEEEGEQDEVINTGGLRIFG